MRHLSLLAPLFLVLCFSGCEPCRHYNRLQVVTYAARAPRRPYGTIQPYQNAHDVGRPFDVVGFMSCEAPAADEAAVLKAMLYRAADMGGDGVLLNALPVSGDNLTAAKLDVRIDWAAQVDNSDNRAYRAQVIRFK